MLRDNVSVSAATMGDGLVCGTEPRDGLVGGGRLPGACGLAAIAESDSASATPQEWLVPLVGLLLATASWMMAGPWLPRVPGACHSRQPG